MLTNSYQYIFLNIFSSQNTTPKINLSAFPKEKIGCFQKQDSNYLIIVIDCTKKGFPVVAANILLIICVFILNCIFF